MKLPELRTGVNGLEDGIITLSGPALAISGVIAGVDLVTGGHLLQQYAWFTLAWAICLLLTLDFQVLALGARAHQVYLSDKATRRKVVEIALSFLIAAAISFVSIQMQSIIARVNGVSGLTIEQAAAQLGINPIWLIWERSALVLVLIFMSGWFREEQPQHQEQPAAGGTNTALTDEALQLILSKLAKLDELEQRLAQPVMVSEAALLQLQAPASVEQPGKVDQGFGQNGTNEPDKPEVGFGDMIEALLATEPGLDEKAVAGRVGCSITTAKKWMKRLEVPGA